jgi:pimeloyl-ACP methyl ester carboxylesterase
MQLLLDHADLVASLTLVNPVSPYGFGGTKDPVGTPCYDDFAGSGGGTVNPEFVRRIQEGDRSEEDPNSPLNVINTFYYVPPFRAAREDDFLTSALLERIGEDRYPGDLAPSENWPNVAPGVYGPINAGSPKYYNLSSIAEAPHKPPILWVRGDSDMIVSDASMFDFGTLGQMDLVPGWPGEDVFPPQPMVSQTRAVLEQYKANGGAVEEVVIANSAHGPHIEKPEEFMAALLAHLGSEQ